jgi:hypothetical protein
MNHEEDRVISHYECKTCSQLFKNSRVNNRLLQRIPCCTYVLHRYVYGACSSTVVCAKNNTHKYLQRRLLQVLQAMDTHTKRNTSGPLLFLPTTATKSFKIVTANFYQCLTIDYWPSRHATLVPILPRWWYHTRFLPQLIEQIVLRSERKLSFVIRANLRLLSW